MRRKHYWNIRLKTADVKTPEDLFFYFIAIGRIATTRADLTDLNSAKYASKEREALGIKELSQTQERNILPKWDSARWNRKLGLTRQKIHIKKKPFHEKREGLRKFDLQNHSL